MSNDRSYEALTKKWMRDVRDPMKAELLDQLTDELGSRREAIAGIVAVTASGHFDTHRHHNLAAWRASLREECSSHYRALRTREERKAREAGCIPPSRHELNQDPTLYDMNALKLGVHRAMVAEQQLASRHRERLAQLPSPDM